MTYNPTQPTDLPSPSIAVDQIRTNFSQYATVFDNNHVALNASSQGKHSNVILQRQASDPALTLGNFDDLYGKSVTSNSSTADEVFIKLPRFLPFVFSNLPMQLTFNSVNTAGPQYQSFMAGGYILYFGTVALLPATITLNPAPSLITCIIANSNNSDGGTPDNPFDIAVLPAANSTSFTITSAGATGAQTIPWFCIGKQ